MQTLKDKLRETLRTIKTQRRDQKKYLKLNKLEIKRVIAGLEVIEEYVMSITFDTECINIMVSGDHHVLGGFFQALRKLGYKPDTRLKEDSSKITGFSTWWHSENEELDIWMSFSSTKCTRKKIGTEMVEQGIYEIVCD